MPRYARREDSFVRLTVIRAAPATVITPTIRRTTFFAATDLNDMEVPPIRAERAVDLEDHDLNDDD